MRLLLLTRKIDSADSRASFVSDWLLALSKNLDRLIVLCQEAGETNGLPKNVSVYSLGKESGKSKLAQLLFLYFYFFKFLRRVDGVFAHQMPIFAILAGPWCKIFRKKLIQWYTHKSVDWRLRLANIFVDEYATASQESFRLNTKKTVHILGHGINVSRFAPISNFPASPAGRQILTIGRISPSKDYESMIKAVYELKERRSDDVELTIIGAPVGVPGLSYLASLDDMVEKMSLSKQVEFIGGLPHHDTVPYLQSADLFINLSDTGSLDKAVLEAMAAGCLVLTSNTAFKSILPDELFTTKDNPRLLADKIKELLNLDEARKIEQKKKLRQAIVEHHNLKDLAGKIVGLFK